MNNLKNLFSKSWIFILIALIGISLKFYRLDYKMFWYDELATVFHVAGADDVLHVSDAHLNEIVNIHEYTRLLRHSDFDYKLLPQLKKQLQNMNLNPLHYPLLSFWYRLVGDEFIHYRLFSVLVFLLTLPFLFLLAKELAGTSRSGWIAVSLYSVSPFIHYFAQEARYYILWAFLLVVIHYFLLKSVNSGKNKYWIGYVFFSVLSLYASILSGFMLFEHLLFVWIVKKEWRLKFLFALLVIFVFYSPWFFYLVANRHEIFAALAWHKFQTVPWWAPLLGMVLGYVRTFSFYQNYTLFWDDVFNNITPAMILETVLNLLVLALFIASAVFLIRKAKRENAWFILLLIIPGLIFFYSLDIARNAITTHWWRYYIFNTIPLILLVTIFIEAKIAAGKWLYALVYSGLIVLSIYSVFTISNYRYWYLGGNWQQEFVDNATLLSEARRPLLITDFVWNNSPVEGRMHVMESLVDCTSDNVDVLRVSSEPGQIESMIPSGYYSDIFVIYASDVLLDNLKNYFGERMEMLPGKTGPPRWRISL
jgi:uncharacterized membrane protein